MIRRICKNFPIQVAGLLVANTLMTIPQKGYGYSLRRPRFPVEHKGVHANIIGYSERDGNSAKMIAVIQEQNIVDACNYHRPPALFGQCYAETMRTHAGRRYEMYANCPIGRVTTHWGKTFDLNRKVWKPLYGAPSKGFWHYEWRDISTGRIVESGGASGDDDITRIHFLLCPGYHVKPSSIGNEY